MFTDFIDLLILSRAKKVIAISKAVKKYFSNNFFYNFKNKINVIYYGFDQKYIESCLEKKVYKKYENLKKEDEVLFGYIGRLVKQKMWVLL